jgi:ubiquinol-cytochrome c reductase cytochrome c1 subunit
MMDRVRTSLLAAALALPLAVAAQAPAVAAEAIELPEMEWSFDGIFGTFDRAALQRGLQVYVDVCKGCHALSLVAFRDLGLPGGPGLGEEEIKAVAASFPIVDGPNDEGEMFERDGRPSDRFPAPFANEQAARYNNNGAYPPDLSLVAKSREGGPDYIRALLAGYIEPPADFELLDGMSYNAYFPGHQIAMPPPLVPAEGDTYPDGTPMTVEQMASDVAHFLTWAAEPKLEQRKRTGIKVILFLVVLTALLYAVKRKVWADVH